MKVKAILAYDGSEYYGSQIQRDKKTIMGELQNVLIKIGINSKINFSGRTDKNVHATYQVCDFEIPSYWKDLQKLQDTLNKMLPSSIMIKKIRQTNDDFHSRYLAKKRAYRYIIKTTKTTPFEAKYISFIPEANLKEIKQKIDVFIGRYDFSYFIKTGSETKTNIRTIFDTKAYKYKNYIVLYFEAEGFLRTQIRFMVSSLINLDKKQIKEMLYLKKRYKIKPAIPNGLYLAKIKY